MKGQIISSNNLEKIEPETLSDVWLWRIMLGNIIKYLQVIQISYLLEEYWLPRKYAKVGMMFFFQDTCFGVACAQAQERGPSAAPAEIACPIEPRDSILLKTATPSFICLFLETIVLIQVFNIVRRAWGLAPSNWVSSAISDW